MFEADGEVGYDLVHVLLVVEVFFEVVLEVLSDLVLEIGGDLFLDHVLIDDAHLLLHRLLVLDKFLEDNSDSVDDEGEDPAGADHGDDGEDVFLAIDGVDITVADRDHGGYDVVVGEEVLGVELGVNDNFIFFFFFFMII